MITGNTKNVDAELLRRLSAWNEALGNKYAVHVGYRSNEDQQIAYDKYLAGTGPLAAKPGTSKHNQMPALAVDLRGANSYAAGSGHTTYEERVLGKKYGLTWPVGFKASGSVEFGTIEPWHVEKLPGWTGQTWTNLKVGSRGESVKKWQAWLKAMFSYGSSVVADGIFGPKTEAATKEFQRRVAVTADGIVGLNTLNKAKDLGFRP